LSARGLTRPRPGFVTGGISTTVTNLFSTKNNTLPLMAYCPTMAPSRLAVGAVNIRCDPGLNNATNRSDNPVMEIEIYNYFEKLVLNQVEYQLSEQGKEADSEYVADIACVALNQLPAKYVRHVIDASFFMTEEEHGLAIAAVVDAVRKAIAFIDERRFDSPSGESGRL
jgi:hypothetical protein